MQYIYRDSTGVLEAHRRNLRGFELCLWELRIADTVMYPLSNLARILGYRRVQGLKMLLSQAPDFLLTMDDAFRPYLLDRLDFDAFEPTFEEFISELNYLVPDDMWEFKKRSCFTTLDGIMFILSHNTMTSDRVKKALCNALDIEREIICPSRPETHFYDRICSMLSQWGYRIERQYAIGTYRLDFAVFNEDGKFKCAVEYDEPGHRWYDEEKEHERQAYLGRHHIRVIRVDSKTKPEALCKSIIDLK